MNAPEIVEVGSSIWANLTQILYPIILLFVGLGTLWTLLTKRMKKDIASKVDQKEFDNLKNKVESQDRDIDKLEVLNTDTNNKVNNIWEYVVTGKLKINLNEEEGN